VEREGQERRVMVGVFSEGAIRCFFYLNLKAESKQYVFFKNKHLDNIVSAVITEALCTYYVK